MNDIKYQVGKITAKLNKITNQQNINRALAAGADVLYKEAAKNIPINDGDLLRGLKITDPKDNSIEVYNDAYHAPFIEFGTGIYASGGMGRQTPWVWYDISGEYTKDGNPGFITTRGYNPDEDRPRGGHFMLRASQTAEQDAIKAFEKALMEGTDDNQL